MKQIKIIRDNWHVTLMEEVNRVMAELGDRITDIQYQAAQCDRYGMVHSVMIVYEDKG